MSATVETEWWREGDLNPRDPFESTRVPGVTSPEALFFLSCRNKKKEKWAVSNSPAADPARHLPPVLAVGVSPSLFQTVLLARHHGEFHSGPDGCEYYQP